MIYFSLSSHLSAFSWSGSLKFWVPRIYTITSTSTTSNWTPVLTTFWAGNDALLVQAEPLVQGVTVCLSPSSRSDYVLMMRAGTRARDGNVSFTVRTSIWSAQRLWTSWISCCATTTRFGWRRGRPWITRTSVSTWKPSAHTVVYKISDVLNSKTTP